MPGLPFGAARQRPVPQDALCYEGIEAIEFIEMPPDLPFPRSVAYRPTSDGAEARVRDFAPDIEDVRLSKDEALLFLDRLVRSGVFAWRRVYRPAQGNFANVGHEWRLEVRFSKGPSARKAPAPFRAEGENVRPDNFEEVVRALMSVRDGALPEESSASDENARVLGDADDRSGAEDVGRPGERASEAPEA